MTRRLCATSILFLVAACIAAGTQTAAQGPEKQSLPAVASGCDQALPAPAAEPQAGSVPVVLFLEMCFPGKGSRTQAPADRYFEHIRVFSFVSKPSRGVWRPFTAEVEQTVTEDLIRLRALSFVAGATVTFSDYQFPNGAVGKVITYHLVERAERR
jgi:hypothetical protein